MSQPVRQSINRWVVPCLTERARLLSLANHPNPLHNPIAQVVAGNVFFTGCTFTTTMLLCNYASAGWNIATLGGTTVVTFTTFQWQSLAMSMAVAGMVLFTGGGATVLTGVDFRFVSPLMNFMGMGTFATGAGALVLTGVTQEQAFACFSAFGVGMYNALGSGVMAEQGATYTQFSGPTYLVRACVAYACVCVGACVCVSTRGPFSIHPSDSPSQPQPPTPPPQSMTGAMTFVGTGSSTHIGVPASMYGSTGTQHGQVSPEPCSALLCSAIPWLGLAWLGLARHVASYPLSRHHTKHPHTPGRLLVQRRGRVGVGGLPAGHVLGDLRLLRAGRRGLARRRHHGVGGQPHLHAHGRILLRGPWHGHVRRRRLGRPRRLARRHALRAHGASVSQSVMFENAGQCCGLAWI